MLIKHQDYTYAVAAKVVDSEAFLPLSINHKTFESANNKRIELKKQFDMVLVITKITTIVEEVEE